MLLRLPEIPFHFGARGSRKADRKAAAKGEKGKAEGRHERFREAGSPAGAGN